MKVRTRELLAVEIYSGMFFCYLTNVVHRQDNRLRTMGFLTIPSNNFGTHDPQMKEKNISFDSTIWAICDPQKIIYHIMTS